MSQQVIIDNELVQLIYYPEARIIHHTILQPVSHETFRSLLTQGTTLLEQFGAVKWLSDDRGNGALDPEDMLWAETDWMRRTFDAGWAFWAIVVPAELQARVSLSTIMQQYSSQGLKIRVFSDPQSARTWLEHA